MIYPASDLYLVCAALTKSTSRRQQNEDQNVNCSDLFIICCICFIWGDKITIDDIYGTWVNLDYNYTGQYAKVVINPDGIMIGYAKETDKEAKWIGQFTITDSWHDNEGNLWI